MATTPKQTPMLRKMTPMLRTMTLTTTNHRDGMRLKVLNISFTRIKKNLSGGGPTGHGLSVWQHNIHIKMVNGQKNGHGVKLPIASSKIQS